MGLGCGLDIADVLQSLSLRSTIVPAVSRATPPLLATYTKLVAGAARRRYVGT